MLDYYHFDPETNHDDYFEPDCDCEEGPAKSRPVDAAQQYLELVEKLGEEFTDPFRD